jgi:hypothetical protein
MIGIDASNSRSPRNPAGSTVASFCSHQLGLHLPRVRGWPMIDPGYDHWVFAKALAGHHVKGELAMMSDAMRPLASL